MKAKHIIAAGLSALVLTGLPLATSTSSLALVSIARAAETLKTTTFDVPGMTCALCPVTVKKAMEGVQGVKKVDINFKARTATVVFDPARATIDAIAAASANAGYPVKVKG